MLLKKVNKFIIPCLTILLFLLLAGFSDLPKPQQFPPGLGKEDTPLTDEPSESNPNNETCLTCHSKAEQVLAFPNGDTVSIYIDRAGYDASVHAKQDCLTCHAGYSSVPHPAIQAEGRREYTFSYTETCKECHSEQYNLVKDSMHAQALEAGNLNAPSCSDCHNPHTQTTLWGANDSLSKVNRIWIPNICAQCHSQIYETYSQSVHGQDLTSGSNFDVPTCIDCHGVHKIQDPQTAGFRASSIEMCANCHTNPTVMNKYGISTDVLNTYVADFHGTTVLLFEKQHPDEITNKAVCYDCHGIHDIARTDDPEKGLQIKQNLLATCKKCHPDAEANFPDSWLSHYTPNKDKYPVVYYIQVFYNILIPAVLGGMAFYIATDIFRRQVNRRAKAGKSAPPIDDNSESFEQKGGDR